MKLSIWQQFSSNHNGFFWVVGTFDTVEDAQKAYNEIRDMLYAINNWHLENPEGSEKAFLSGNNEPLPIEKEFAQKYNVEWPRTIDWTNWPNLAEIMINEAISITGRTVEIETPDQTWMGIQPFEGILARLGAETFGIDMDLIQAGMDEIHWCLMFTAPDLDTAKQIETAVREHISDPFKTPQNEIEQLLRQLRLRREVLSVKRDTLNFRLNDISFDHDKGLSLFIEWLEANKFTNIDYVYLRRLEDHP